MKIRLSEKTRLARMKDLKPGALFLNHCREGTPAILIEQAKEYAAFVALDGPKRWHLDYVDYRGVNRGPECTIVPFDRFSVEVTTGDWKTESGAGNLVMTPEGRGVTLFRQTNAGADFCHLSLETWTIGDPSEHLATRAWTLRLLMGEDLVCEVATP